MCGGWHYVPMMNHDIVILYGLKHLLRGIGANVVVADDALNHALRHVVYLNILIITGISVSQHHDVCIQMLRVPVRKIILFRKFFVAKIASVDDILHHRSFILRLPPTSCCKHYLVIFNKNCEINFID